MGSMDQLASAMALLNGSSDEASLLHQKTATASELGIAEDAHDSIVAIRNAVVRSKAGTKELKTAIGAW